MCVCVCDNLFELSEVTNFLHISSFFYCLPVAAFLATVVERSTDEDLTRWYACVWTSLLPGSRLFV